MTRVTHLALSYFKANGVEATAGDGTIATRRGRYGLFNLAQHLRQLPEDQWTAYIGEHFDRLRSVTADMPADYGEARHRLRVRLSTPEAVEAAHVRPLNGVLQQVLMLKIPQGGISVSGRAAAEWSVGEDEMWSDATSNTRWDEPHRLSRLVSPAGDIFTRVDGSFWSSSLLTDLSTLLPSPATAGALAIIPCQDLLVFRHLDAQPPWTDLLSLAGTMFELGPGSIAPDLFWWHEGRLERVVRFGDRGPVPTWSTRFRSTMDEMSDAA